ncbi:MAG: HAMP domain-containing sensor histidine kinase [Patescibacteria group bacterium]
MTLVPFELAFPLSAALAVFGIGLVVWLSGKWSRGNVLFAHIAFTLALWTSVDWFRTLEPTALPLQVIIWRMLFYLSIALAPAIAIHLSCVIARRPLSRAGMLAYAVAVLEFVLIDTAFLMRSVFGYVEQGTRLLNVGATLGLAFSIVAAFCIAMALYPTVCDTAAKYHDRRRVTYGILILLTYLAADVTQFVVTPTPFPYVLVMTVLSAVFFFVSSAAFIRAKLLDVNFAALESLFLVLAAGSVVTVLRASTFTEGIVALLGAMLIGLFGIRAIRVVRDESRRRHELERINTELKALDTARRDLVASVAHQLRGPLGGIRFAADMFERGDYGPLTPEGKQVMRHIQTGADRLLELAETSLNVARVEAGIFQSMPTDIDVAAELRDLMGDLDLKARTKGVTIESKFRSVPARLRLDKEALRNAVFNVLDNAVKYTDRGRIALDAACEDRHLVISVSDTGAGLTQTDLSHLFQKFSRGEEAKKRSIDGSGLGLYVSKRLIEEMGGTISAGSAGLGKGSTFRIRIPIAS